MKKALTVKVKTKANSFKILSYDKKQGILRVAVKAEPVKNKANKELVKELSKIIGDVQIIKGMTSNTKTILVDQEQLKKLEAYEQV